MLVVSVGAGFGLGVGLSRMSGNAAAAPAALPTAASVNGATGATGASGATGVAGGGSISVLSSRCTTAASTLARGLTFTSVNRSAEARTGRVAVRLRVRAGREPVRLGTVRLISGEARRKIAAADRRAAAPLLDAVAAGEEATGELVFRTSGGLTELLAGGQGAMLSLGDRTLELELELP